jgi:GT2 family glycosyltransferase/glycosyltransferase involved in cell wall biosynthesis
MLRFIEKYLEFARLIQRLAIDRQKRLGKSLALQDIPKLIKKVIEIYQLQNSRQYFVKPYDAWLRVNYWNKKAETHLKSRLILLKNNPPLISIIIPVYNPELEFLNKAIKSVIAQVYQNWELCIADDCSSNPEIKNSLIQWQNKEKRICVIFREENGNISVATNTAVSLANGEFLLFLDHDDELTPNALGEVALYLSQNPTTDYLYSDDDKIDVAGRRYDPQFKPDWSPELLLSYCYFSHLCVVRREIFERVQGLRQGFEGSQDYDFALRATEISRHVGHIPLILYHWRATADSTAMSGKAKPSSFQVGQKAVQEALNRRGINATVYQPEWAKAGSLGIFDHHFPDSGPSIAIIIPTKNQHNLLRSCLESLKKTTYQNYQIVIIDNESDDFNSIEYLNSLTCQVLKISNPNQNFNFAAINNQAVKQIEADYILFFNNDVEVISPLWLSQMVGYAQITGVGAVGAKLIYPDSRIQHAGIVHGFYHGLAGPAFKLMSKDEAGYLSYAKVVRNYSAVTAACLLTPRDLFLTLGGFNEENFAVAYNDVDYCYRLVEAGYRCVYCPTAELIHKEGASRGYRDNPRELANFKNKYFNKIDNYYSPHLSLENERFSIHPCNFVLGSIKPIKTLVCTHNLNSEGAPNSQFELTVKLKESGIIDPIVYSPYSGSLQELYQKAGVPVYIEKSPMKETVTANEYQKKLAFFSDFVKRLNVELVYANTLQTFYTIDVANQLNLPSIWNIRESEIWQDYLKSFPKELAKIVINCFSIPYRVIFVADATKERYKSYNSYHNFTVIHNALNLDRLASVSRNWTRNSAREYLKIPDRDIVILALGTVCTRKGQLDLLQAIKVLSEKYTDRIKVLVVGDRPILEGNILNTYSQQLHALREKLPERIQERVSIIHETSDTAVYYHAADIFVFTSRIESYPRVILEAMSYQLPIITTPVYGVVEQVQEEVNGIFYQPGNIHQLASSIKRLIDEPSLRHQFAENSPLVLQGLNSFESMVNSYGQLFKEAFFSR